MKNWENNDFGKKLRNYESPLDVNKSWQIYTEKVRGKRLKTKVTQGLYVGGIIFVTFVVLWALNQSERSQNISDSVMEFEQKNDSTYSLPSLEEFPYENGSLLGLSPVRTNSSNISLKSGSANYIFKQSQKHLGSKYQIVASDLVEYTSSSMNNKQHTEIINIREDGYAEEVILQKKEVIFEETDRKFIENAYKPEFLLVLPDSLINSLYLDSSIQSKAKNPKKHTLSLDYNFGIKEYEFVVYATTHQSPGTIKSGWRPHGHQSILIGYGYELINKITLQGNFSYGFGYLNDESSYITQIGSSGSQKLKPIILETKEWGSEVMAIFSILEFQKMKTRIGLGTAYRNASIKYTAGELTTIQGPLGELQSGESASFHKISILPQASVVLSYRLPNNKYRINLSGIYQHGTYRRPALRIGVSYNFYETK